MKDVSVTLEAELPEGQDCAKIYQLHVADREETLRAAEEFFAGLGTQVEPLWNDYYENTAVYYSESGGYNLWIDYAGCTLDFHHFSAGWENGEKVPEKAGAGREEVEAVLSALGVSIPEEALFEDKENGMYLFTAERTEEDGTMYDGTLFCIYHVNGKMSEVDNRIIAFQEYREGQIRTAQEAALDYEVDSKGYYQPIYLFKVLCNEREMDIAVPALR